MTKPSSTQQSLAASGTPNSGRAHPLPLARDAECRKGDSRLDAIRG
jgi:hypothetical protein